MTISFSNETISEADKHTFFTSTCAQRFEAQVELSPDALAVVCDGQQLSYRELNQQANQLAHALRSMGVEPEMLVALLAERGIPLLLSILAVFKAGAAYLPLDPAHPESRLRHVMKQSGCQFVLCTGAFADTCSKTILSIKADHRPCAITFEQVPLDNYPQNNLPASNEPDSLVYVIYTSGSTGKPKGAMVEQRGMINHLYAKIEALNLGSSDRVAQTASQCFDISVWQFLAALLVGAQVHIYPDAISHDATALLQQVEQQQISILETVPSFLRAILDTYEREGVTRPSLQALRWLIPTGEALPVSLCRRWLTSYPRIPLLNAYGPTECSDDVTHYAIFEPPSETLKSIPIGTAIPNMQLYVLDQQLQPQPVGVSGELYVGGIGVGRGYLNDEKRTAQSFLPDPFSKEEGARLYKTGDLGRFLPDDNLEFLGRIDFQVKVRGYRIELEEIETVLSKQTGVQEAAVGVQGEEQGEARLVAYVVPQPGQSISIEALKAQVKLQLPTYMVPSAFAVLDHLPLTSNGKLDRKALPQVDVNSREEGAGYVAAVTLLQQQLIELWEQVLGVHPVGINDDFFELGGDSLQAIRIFDQIEQFYGKRLALSTLFASATVAHVAQVLRQTPDQQIAGESRAPFVVVQKGGSQRPFFFLHGQWKNSALYTLELARALGPERPFYALEPYRFDGLKVPPTLEELAAEHLKVLRQIQPEGPYLLGGWCNGGLTAYEMSRQLHAQGQVVDVLVVMDADAPAPRFMWESRIINAIVKLLRRGPETQVDWFLVYRHLRLSFHYWRLAKIQSLKDALHATFASKPEKDYDRPVESQAIIPSIATLRSDWVSIFDWMSANYMHHPYPGKVTFLWTAEEPWRKELWHKLLSTNAIGEVEAHIIPGDHITSRTVHLPALAERLASCLKNA